jgi:signal recognition particle GTPase
MAKRTKQKYTVEEFQEELERLTRDGEIQRIMKMNPDTGQNEWHYFISKPEKN